MAAVVDVGNPIEIRNAGIRILKEHLGLEAARVFMKNFRRGGDYTAEKYDAPEHDFDALTKELAHIDAQIDAGVNVWK